MPPIDRRNRAPQPQTRGLPVHFHFRGDGTISREILVAGKGKAKSAILRRLLPLQPSKPSRRLLDHLSPARIVEMFHPEFDGTGPIPTGQLVPANLDRKTI